jgi:HD superfamily phosphohydrolase
MTMAASNRSFDEKRIADPVHGTIGLSALEARVISTRAFQRLRNVKQLGLAHYVFPGADYSRFSHSLGVCHLTGRMIDTLKNFISSSGRQVDPEHDLGNDNVVQLYRLAGLLHDLGHYPFSHTTEHAGRSHYRGKGVAFIRHEEVGKQVLLNDSELRTILEEDGLSADTIASIFTRETMTPYSRVISSDLDADRMDYLLRNAHHTGLPYGLVDLDYLLTQFRLDNTPQVCLSHRALKTADHFLLGRYFDYQQV